MQRNILSFILLLLLTTYGFAQVRKKVEVLPSPVTIDNQQHQVLAKDKSSENLTNMIVQSKDGKPQHAVQFTSGENSVTILSSTLNRHTQQLELTYQQKYIAQHLLQIKSFSIGKNTNKPEKIIYAFVDPNCGYCNQLEAAVKNKANHSKFTFKFIPVGVITNKSPQEIADAVNLNHSTHFTAQEINKNTKIFIHAMLRGTPTCFQPNRSQPGPLSKILCTQPLAEVSLNKEAIQF
jgi:protein-disulfide isomerase